MLARVGSLSAEHRNTENKLAQLHKLKGSIPRVKLAAINKYLTCTLCNGYFINATTIIECGHTFCKSCIVRYLSKSKQCPTCDRLVHAKKPLSMLRSDPTLQDIIYKIVPDLYSSEMGRRRDYYDVHSDVRIPSLPEDRGVGGAKRNGRMLISSDEMVSLSLEYAIGTNQKPINEDNSSEKLEPPDEEVQRRYLNCPAPLTVRHLQKFLRNKYGVRPQYGLEIFYLFDTLHEELSLMDIAYIYNWTRKRPLRLYFKAVPLSSASSSSSGTATNVQNTSSTSTPTKMTEQQVSNKSHPSSINAAEMKNVPFFGKSRVQNQNSDSFHSSSSVKISSSASKASVAKLNEVSPHRQGKSPDSQKSKSKQRFVDGPTSVNKAELHAYNKEFQKSSHSSASVDQHMSAIGESSKLLRDFQHLSKRPPVPENGAPLKHGCPSTSMFQSLKRPAENLDLNEFYSKRSHDDSPRLMIDDDEQDVDSGRGSDASPGPVVCPSPERQSSTGSRKFDSPLDLSNSLRPPMTLEVKASPPNVSTQQRSSHSSTTITVDKQRLKIPSSLTITPHVIPSTRSPIIPTFSSSKSFSSSLEGSSSLTCVNRDSSNSVIPKLVIKKSPPSESVPPNYPRASSLSSPTSHHLVIS